MMQEKCHPREANLSSPRRRGPRLKTFVSSTQNDSRSITPNDQIYKKNCQVWVPAFAGMTSEGRV